MGLSTGTVITELEARCAPHLMVPLSSKYSAFHAFKGKTQLMQAELYVKPHVCLRCHVASALALLSTGVPAQDVAGEPEAESHGGGVLPEAEVVGHGGEAGLRG